MSLFQDFPTKFPRVCLSFGIERAILNRISTCKILDVSFLRDVVLSSYSLVYDDAIVTELASDLIARVLERIDELNKPNTLKSSGPPSGKHFGSSYADWLAGLDATQSCLYLADFDIEKALHYYWNEDYRIVQEAVKTKSTKESQQALSAFEATMYGTGGKYSDDNSGEDANTVNLDELSEEDLKAALNFSNFGF